MLWKDDVFFPFFPLFLRVPGFCLWVRCTWVVIAMPEFSPTDAGKTHTHTHHKYHVPDCATQKLQSKRTNRVAGLRYFQKAVKNRCHVTDRGPIIVSISRRKRPAPAGGKKVDYRCLPLCLNLDNLNSRNHTPIVAFLRAQGSECAATYSGRLAVARSFIYFIRQWQQQCSSVKLLS